MATFVLVHGGWHGGWCFDEVTALLRSRGHTVYAPTLSGLEDAPAADGSAVTLATHVEQVIRLLRAEDLREVVLCGHSSAGVVVSGVADSVPERLAAVVHADAYVPSHGDSVWSLTSDAFRALFVAGARKDGLTIAPPPKLLEREPRCRPHPAGAFLQGVSLRGAWARVPRRVFILASEFRASPFRRAYERCRQDPAWTAHELPHGHDLMHECPHALAELLVDAAA